MSAITGNLFTFERTKTMLFELQDSFDKLNESVAAIIESSHIPDAWLSDKENQSKNNALICKQITSTFSYRLSKPSYYLLNDMLQNGLHAQCLCEEIASARISDSDPEQSEGLVLAKESILDYIKDSSRENSRINYLVFESLYSSKFSLAKECAHILSGTSVAAYEALSAFEKANKL